MKKFVRTADLILFITNCVLLAYAVFAMFLRSKILPQDLRNDWDFLMFWDKLYIDATKAAICLIAVWYIIRWPLIFICRVKPRPKVWYAVILFLIHLPLALVVALSYFTFGL